MKIKLTESQFHTIIRESAKRIINEVSTDTDAPNELYDEWYEQEDYNGNTGEPGMIKSYEIGTYYMSQAEEDARECGYDNVEDYLEYWFSEIQPECPWYWTKTGGGYGYNGTTIFKNDGVVCKNIFDQIMIDEYPIADPHRDVKESVYKPLTEGEKWVGDFERTTFDKLRQYANELGGKCSFSLNGVDFTMIPTQRGFTITSGTQFRYDAFNIDSALKAAWQYSNRH